MASGRPRIISVLAMLLLLLCADARAQTGTATITGLITDQTGAILPGVTVTATNQATNVDYTAVTNESGDYTITPVVAGTYVIKAALSGFRTQATVATVLEARQVARLDFKMGVGIAETVEVSEATPILQTETTAVGEVLSGNTVQSLPLNGRNTGQLALLLPGTMTYNPRGFTNIGSINMNRPFVNGNREQTNNFTVDGLDVNETIDNRVAYQPSPDALSQISVETNNYPADVGNVGGASISSVIKSGGNRFSGNAYEFYRNSDFDANTWENNRSLAAKQERKQHIYGGTIGGPIAANKVFFFGDYQGSRHDAPGQTTATVAPESWRRGDLSSFTTPIINPQTGLAFPGNQIPVSMFSPTARAILNDLVNYPLPNRTVTGVTGNYVGPTLFTVRAHQGDARIDWSASENDKFFGRYSFATYEDRRDQQPFALFLGSRNDQPFHNVGFNWNRVIGTSKVNELLVGFSHTTVTAETFDWAGIGDGNALYGIAGGQPIGGLSQIQWGTPLTLARLDRDRLGHAGEDLSNQREADLAARPTFDEVRRPVPALRPAALLCRQQRICSASLTYSGSVHRRGIRRLPARSGRRQRARRRRSGRSLDAPAESDLSIRAGRSQTDQRRDAEPRHALGVHVAAGRERQSAVEFQSGHRRADLRGGWRPRRARALQAVLQRIRAASRGSVAGERSCGGARRLRHFPVHGRHRR